MPAVAHVADHVCPLAGECLADGGVLVEAGKVVTVGPVGALAGRAARTVRHRGVLVPGLADARTRVEWADARRLGVAASGWDGERWSRSAHRGAHELLRAGCTLAADLVARGAGVTALGRAGIAGDSLVELAGIEDAEADAVLAAVARSLERPAQGRRVGVAVQADGVGRRVLAGAATLAEQRGAPLHVEVGAAGLPALESAGLLRPGVRLAGFTEPDAATLRAAAARRAVVVWSPDAPVPLRPLAETGGRIALGSDPARRPDPLATAAAWAEAARAEGFEAWPPAIGTHAVAGAALRLVGAEGAEGIGHPGRGALVEGGPADFTVVDVPAEAEAGGCAEALLAGGAGRQVLTVVGGVRRARRRSAAEPWPALGDHKFEVA